MAIALDSPESLAIKVKKTRRAVGISQRKLAMLSGVSQSTVARIENDIEKLNPSYATIFNVMDTLERFEENGSVEFMAKKARDIMQREIVAVKPGDTAKKAIGIIKNYDFPQLPVLKGGRAVGTVSQKRLFGIATEGQKAASKIHVKDILEMAMPQVDADTELSKLKRILESFDAVLVVEKDRVAGIITIYDILRVI